MPADPAPEMSLPAALEVVQRRRTDDDVVVTTMANAREWMRLGMHQLDFVYAPSSMGQAPALGLGIALAQPHRRVIVFNGDGCMLMNLGVLVTLTAAAPPNLVLILCDNACYEVTGRQATAASPEARATPVDWLALARGSGFTEVHAFDDVARWEAQADAVLGARGPVFVWLRVAPLPGASVPKPPAHSPTRVRDFAASLAARG